MGGQAAIPLNIASTMRVLRLFALPVAVLLLAAQCMPALWQMNCQDMGRTTVHWGQAESCCLHKEAPEHMPAFNRLCCTFNEVEAVLDAQQRTSAAQLPEAGPATDMEFAACEPPFIAICTPIRFADKPPPRGTVLDGLIELGILRL
mgnify:CR=1 FL=1